MSWAERGSWFFKIVWKWRLPHAARSACLNGNIISNPVVTDVKVFVTTIIGTFRHNSHHNWQSGTRTASERWEISLVKEIRRGWFPQQPHYRNPLDQIPMYSLQQQLSKRAETTPRTHAKDSSAAFMPWSTWPESSEMSIVYSDSGCAVISQ